MPLRVVQHVKKTWEETGEVCRDRKYMGRTPLLSMVETQVRVWTMFSATPYSYAHAPVHAGIGRTHPRYVSLAAISRTLKQLGISLKKVRHQPAKLD
jgi:transposase